jgi:hypothetical protein
MAQNCCGGALDNFIEYYGQVEGIPKYVAGPKGSKHNPRYEDLGLTDYARKVMESGEKQVPCSTHCSNYGRWINLPEASVREDRLFKLLSEDASNSRFEHPCIKDIDENYTIELFEMGSMGSSKMKTGYFRDQTIGVEEKVRTDCGEYEVKKVNSRFGDLTVGKNGKDILMDGRRISVGRGYLTTAGPGIIPIISNGRIRILYESGNYSGINHVAQHIKDAKETQEKRNREMDALQRNEDMMKKIRESNKMMGF